MPGPGRPSRECARATRSALGTPSRELLQPPEPSGRRTCLPHEALAVGLTLSLVAALAGAPPADADKDDRIVGLLQLGRRRADRHQLSAATDPYLHVRFKRVGGEGQRQVRMGERHKMTGTHQWGPTATPRR